MLTLEITRMHLYDEHREVTKRYVFSVQKIIAAFVFNVFEIRIAQCFR